MDRKQCYFIFGADTHRTWQARKAIEARFLATPGSMIDFSVYDMEDTPLDTLKQSLLAIPFLVPHRLFVLKNTFTAPKSTLDQLADVLSHSAPTTVIIIYESQTVDKRLGCYKWLINHATVQEYPALTKDQLASRMTALARGCGVTIDSGARLLLAANESGDTRQMALEVAKLASYAQAIGTNTITQPMVEELSSLGHDYSRFKLTDAIRDGNGREAVALYRHFIFKEDAMLLAGSIGGQIRTLAKIFLAQKKGVTRPNAIAQASGLNPYVVKLAFPASSHLSTAKLQAAYRELVTFERNVKSGRATADLALLLLIIRLHDTLKEPVKSAEHKA